MKRRGVIKPGKGAKGKGGQRKIGHMGSRVQKKHHALRGKKIENFNRRGN